MDLTKKDIISMTGLIKANYPYAYRDISKEDMKLLQDTWYRVFAKYPKEVVGAAFQKSLETCKMPPTIADIMEQINEFQKAVEPTEMELWSELIKIISKVNDCVYHFKFNAMQSNGLTQGENARIEFKQIWDTLPSILKEYCGNENGLINLSRLTNDELAYEKGRFLKIFPVLKKREKIKIDINSNVLVMLSGDTKLIE